MGNTPDGMTNEMITPVCYKLVRYELFGRYDTLNTLWILQHKNAKFKRESNPNTPYTPSYQSRINRRGNLAKTSKNTAEKKIPPPKKKSYFGKVPKHNFETTDIQDWVENVRKRTGFDLGTFCVGSWIIQTEIFMLSKHRNSGFWMPSD